MNLHAVREMGLECPLWRRIAMRIHWWPVFLIAVILVPVLESVRSVWATSAGVGFISTTLARSRIRKSGLPLHGNPAKKNTSLGQSSQKTNAESDVYLQSNVWEPGGSTGWHTHPGLSVIIITAGAVTEYESHCTPRVYGPGTALGPTLIDPGEGHVHVLRNEGSVPATGIAVQLLARNAPRRIDATPPDTCPSIF